MPETPLFYMSHPVTTNSGMNPALLQELVQNATTMRKFFTQFFDKRRDLDSECGYPETDSSNPDNYRALFDRMPIARRVVELMPKECWQVAPKVYETEDPDDATEFEQAWDALGKGLRGEASWYQDEEGSPIWEALKRADIMSGIGRFGLLLLGIDDGRNLDQAIDGVVTLTPNRNKKAPSTPVVNKAAFKDDEHGRVALAAEEESIREFIKNYSSDQIPTSPYDNGVYGLGAQSSARLAQDSATYAGIQGSDAQYVGVQLSPPEFPATEVSKQKRNLLFLRVFDESLVQIVQYEADLRNPRFGRPVMYRVTLNDPREQSSGIGLPIATVRVHWSRVIHLADGLQNSEVFGCPRMKPVLNDILDLKKIYGASAEGYWKAAFSILQFSTHPQMGGDVNVDMDRMRETYENVQNSLQRGVIGIGGQWSTISPTVSDPTPHIQVRLTAIGMYLGCPMRVLMGSEQGVLAADQDSASWYLRRVPERQLNYCTPRVIIPVIDRLIQIGVLPVPKIGNDEEESEDENEDEPTTTTNRFSTLPPGVYRRTRVHYEHVYNADTGAIEKKPRTTESTVVKTSGGYSIEWPDLDAMTEKDKVAILAQRATAYGTYISMGLESMIPPKVFMTKFDDMDEEEAETIIQMAQDAHAAEDVMTAPPMEGGFEKAPEEGDAGFEPEPEPEPATPIKVKEGEKLVHPDDVKPTDNAEWWEELRRLRSLKRVEILRNGSLHYESS